MANNTRIYNLTRQYSLKHKQAVRAVENCACAWVEFGVSVRDLSLAESIAARNQRVQQPVGLVYLVEGKNGKLIAKPLFAEQPNCIFRPSESGAAANRAGYELIRMANQFAEMTA